MGKQRHITIISLMLFSILVITLSTNVYALDTDFLFKFGSFGSGDGQLNNPIGVAVDPVSQNIIVVDRSNERVQVFDSNGNFIFKFGSFGFGNGQFNSPMNAAVDPISQNILVSGRFNHNIQVFDSVGNFVTKFGSFGSGDGQFNNPIGMAIDPISRNIMVADYANHRVQVFDSNGNFIFKFGSFGSGDGQLKNPIGVAVDPISQNIIVSDSSNHRVQVFEPNGNFVTKFGSFGTGDGEFNFPVGLTVSNSQNIIVADQSNHRVQVFDSNGNFVTKFGIFGTGDGEFQFSADVAIDPISQNIIVSDHVNHRIQVFGSISPPICVEPPSDLVGWWDADTVSGIIAEDIANGNDATLLNGASISPGKVGNAFKFDGIDDVVEASNESEFDFDTTSSFTLEAWIKPEPKNTGNQFIVAKQDLTDQSGGAPVSGFTLVVADTFNDELALILQHSSPNFIQVRGTTDLIDGQWHHVAGVYDGSGVASGIKLYVDGIQENIIVDKDTLSGGTLLTDAPLTIGTRKDNLGNVAFKGLIDEVEVHNRVLSQTEIKSIFDADSEGKCKPPTFDPLREQIESLGLPNGIENSLLSKLDNAEKSFDKENIDATVNQLEALINEINAQSGKKIDSADADELIAQAQTLIDAIAST